MDIVLGRAKVPKSWRAAQDRLRGICIAKLIAEVRAKSSICRPQIFLPTSVTLPHPRQMLRAFWRPETKYRRLLRAFFRSCPVFW